MTKTKQFICLILLVFIDQAASAIEVGCREKLLERSSLAASEAYLRLVASSGRLSAFQRPWEYSLAQRRRWLTQLQAESDMVFLYAQRIFPDHITLDRVVTEHTDWKKVLSDIGQTLDLSETIVLRLSIPPGSHLTSLEAIQSIKKISELHASGRLVLVVHENEPTPFNFL